MPKLDIAAVSDPVAAAKAKLRQTMLAGREALPVAERVAAAETLAARGLPIPVPPGAVVSGYSPLKSEISPVPLMRRLADAGAKLALPVVQGRSHPLIMRAWAFGEPLGSGVWGIREPKPEAPEVFPDILIVPLLAFDRRGERLGYGAGHYDRTIARLRTMKPIVTIGVAFAAQEVPDLPSTSLDERLDFVLTERDVIDLRA
ncbi:MAG TPA: 5-formyltetrahydrofolate cyclo-ligase [Xanthobacteraceae bacterium]|nr:5-formyltetrahydrofolate cyclo-ligase [Xanthobacteraceae bacterium]